MHREGNILILYLLHKKGQCNPDDCPFCDDPRLEREFDREYQEDIVMGNA